MDHVLVYTFHYSRRLLIDVLHDEMGCGEFMADNLDGTLYPPDSLEQLINIYATQNTSIQHCIVSSHIDIYCIVVTIFYKLGVFMVEGNSYDP